MPTSTQRFRISGVDRDSQFETELVIEASTQENAKVKAELQGVIVTSIECLKPKPTDDELFKELIEDEISKEQTAPFSATRQQSASTYASQLSAVTITKHRTDPFAVVAFATGLLSIWILPIVLAPVCYVFALLSYYRIKEDPTLKGKGLRLIGSICGALSLLYLIYVFKS